MNVKSLEYKAIMAKAKKEKHDNKKVLTSKDTARLINATRYMR